MTDWVLVPGFPDYRVSREGRVQRVKPGVRNHKLTGQDLKWFVSPSGYATVDLSVNGKKKAFRINRMVCEAFNGPPPMADHHAAHIDGVRLNNDASNLRWATPKENESDKLAHGTAMIGDRHWSVNHPEKRAKGSGHGLAKLNEQAIPHIRSSADSSVLLAQTYGVCKDTINNVRSGRTWRHV